MSILQRLPVLPSLDPDSAKGNVTEAYVQEVQQVRTEKHLRAHLQRWRVLWELFPRVSHPAYTSRMRHRMTTQRLPFGKVAKALRKLADEPDKPRKGEIFSMAAEFRLPESLLRSFLAARYFEVSPDLILIQAHGAHEFC